MSQVSSTDILAQNIADLLTSRISKKPIDNFVSSIRDRFCLIMRFQMLAFNTVIRIGNLFFKKFFFTCFDHAQQPFTNKKCWALGSITAPTSTTQLCWVITLNSFFPHRRANGQTFSSLPTPYFRPIHRESIWSHCVVRARDRRHQGFSLLTLPPKHPAIL